MRAGFGGVLGPLEGVRDNKGKRPRRGTARIQGFGGIFAATNALGFAFVIEERTACKDVDGSPTSQMMRI